MDDRGSVLPAVGLLLAGSLMALGLAIDLGRWAAVQREAAFAADAAAMAGAAMIDITAAHGGLIALDPESARTAAGESAVRARPRPGRTIAVDSEPDRICVTVRQPFRPTLLRAFGIGDTTVAAAACAVPARG